MFIAVHEFDLAIWSSNTIQWLSLMLGKDEIFLDENPSFTEDCRFCFFISEELFYSRD